MKNKALLISSVRVFMGSVFLFVGLNGFFRWFPVPEIPSQALWTLAALSATGYFYSFLMVTQIVCGGLLVANLYTPLTLMVTAPLTLNIFLFHAFMDRNHIPIPFALFGSQIFLLLAYRHSYRALFQLRSKPSF